MRIKGLCVGVVVAAVALMATSGWSQEGELSLKDKRLLNEWGELVGKAMSLTPADLKALAQELESSGERLERAEKYLDVQPEEISRLKMLLSDLEKLSRDDRQELLNIIRNQAIKAGSRSAEAIVPLLDSTETDLRLNAAIVLATVGGEKAKAALLKGLKHSDEVIRYWAVKGMIHYEPADVGQALIEVAESDPSEIVRMAAVNVLGELRVEKALETLLDLIGPEAPEGIRFAAVAAAEKITGESFGLDRATSNDQIEAAFDKCRQTIRSRLSG